MQSDYLNLTIGTFEMSDIFYSPQFTNLVTKLVRNILIAK